MTVVDIGANVGYTALVISRAVGEKGLVIALEPEQLNFELLSSQNRYAVLYRIHSAKRSDTRARRIEDFVAMLARGETLHPQKRALAE